jgi:hypothetical protein
MRRPEDTGIITKKVNIMNLLRVLLEDRNELQADYGEEEVDSQDICKGSEKRSLANSL